MPGTYDAATEVIPKVTDPPPRRRRPVRWLVAGLVLAVLAGGAAVAVTRHRAAGAPRPEAPVQVETAKLERRDLSTTKTLPGSIGYGAARPLAGHKDATVTWLPQAGATIKRGKQLFRADDRPVTLFYGSMPLYREIAGKNLVGRDVRIIADNLSALGYSIGSQPAEGTRVTQTTPTGATTDTPATGTASDPATGTTSGTAFTTGTSSGTAFTVGATPGAASATAFTAGAAFGVANLEKERSFSPKGSVTLEPSTPPAGDPAKGTGTGGTSESGTGSNGTGNSGTGSSGTGSSGSTSVRVTVREGEGVLTTKLITAIKRWQDDAGLPVTGAISVGDVEVLSGAVRVEAVAVQPGSPANVDLLSVTSTRKVITLAAELGDAGSIQRGAKVTVALPDDRTVKARVLSVGRKLAAAETDAGTGPPTLTVTVTADEPAEIAGLDSADVQVSFAGRTAADVLAAPVEALVALTEGGYAVQVPAGLVAVTTGMFADGWVEIKGDGLTEGTDVVVSS